MGQQPKWPRINADVHRFVTKALSAFIRVHLWLALLVAPLIAQNAELSGLITDPSGLAVTRANVVVQSARHRRNPHRLFQPAGRVQRLSPSAWPLQHHGVSKRP